LHEYLQMPLALKSPDTSSGRTVVAGEPAERRPLLQWNVSLDTGIPQIDHEHRQLVQIVNQLNGQRGEGADGPGLRAVCGELAEYARHHFAHEDALMDAWPLDAAHVAAHRRAHRDFIERMAQAQALIDTDAEAVVDELMAFLVKWLVHHIRGIDARMAAGIAALRQGSAAPRVVGTDLHDALDETVGELYASLGGRTLELVAANAALCKEVTRRKDIEAALRCSEQRFSRLYQYAPVALWEFDWAGARRMLAAEGAETDAHALVHAVAELRRLELNPAARRQVGLPEPGSAITDAALWRLISPGTAAFAAALLRLHQGEPTCSGEMQVVRTDGVMRDLAFHAVPMPADRTAGEERVVVATLDVTDSKQEMQHLQTLSLHDPLTGLPNRHLLADRLGTALRRADRERRPLALLFIDLDNFKAINDSLGHAAGDAVLQAAARRLAAALRSTDTVARVGGDEMVVLLPGISDRAHAQAIAGKLATVLAVPVDTPAGEAQVAASIGLAVYPQDAADAAGLLTAADAAMYDVKRARKARAAL
jgi:diguanylate cyclase (GGDEF)-like protein/hemerythrin-like metal-binding protein